MSLPYTTPELVRAIRIVPRPYKGRTVSGYGGAIPTRYMVLYGGYWYRVRAMAYGNSAAYYITVNGVDTIIDTDTQYAMGQIPTGQGKFNNARDELLYAMSLEGWANASNGDVQSPTGFFARISNDAREVVGVRDAFPTATRYLLDADIIGHYLCIEDNLGFWHVTSMPSEASLIRAFEELNSAFDEWSDS